MPDNFRRNRAYGFRNALQRLNVLPVIARRNPTANDTRFPLATQWINENTNQVYALTSVVAGAATWSILGPGASDVDTLTGDGGGPISPAAGNITLAGGTNITTAGAGSTITFNLDAAITLATSVTSPIYTAAAGLDINAAAGNDITMQMGDAAGANVIDFEDSTSATVASLDSNGTLTVVNMDGIIGATTPAAITGTTITGNTSVTTPLYTVGAGTDLDIESVAGQDIIMKMGDNAGANKVSFTDSGDVEVFAIDSNGGIGTLAGLTVAGNFAQTAGTFNVGQDNAANAINIGGGNVARAIGLANSAAAHTLTIGNAALGAITMDTGAGFSIDGANTSNITVTSAGLDLNLQGVGCAVNMTSTEAQNDAILIEASAANGGVQIHAGTGGILIGDEADTAGITIGNIAPTQNRTIVIGSGTVVTAAVTDDISIGDGGATTNANSIKHVDINNGGVTLGEVNTYIATGAVTSGTHLTEICTGNRAAGTATLNVSTGTGTKTVNIGNADANTTVNIDAVTAINTDVNAAVTINTGTSTGAITLGAIANSGAVAIESSTTVDVDAAGAVSLNSTGAAINIGDDADAFAINMGTGAAARVITIGNVTGASQTVIDCGTAGISVGASATAHETTVGSTNTTSGLTLQAGTGNITMTGTVEDIQTKFITRTGDDIAFSMSPLTCTAANTGGVATGATSDLNLLTFEEGMIMEQFVLGAGQTIIKPVMDATGLLISGDLTNTEGYEYNFGAARANSRHSFTIGTSPAFFIECQFTVADVSGCEPAYIGFRRTQANQVAGAIANYTDFVAYGPNDGIAPGDAAISTQLNTGGLVNTDTNDAWADAATHTLRINVSAAGVVTFLFDGAPPTATQAFTFDNGDVVHPFWRHEFNAAAPGTIHWNTLQIGFQ